MSVSYTHLDVYKRQDTYKEETNKQMDSGFNNLDETLDSTSEGIKAVSYTHLDVYKRQIQHLRLKLE